MGRWTQYDRDSYRLPEGMQRIGYDADTQQYTYKETTSGTVWEGAPRAKYGVLHPIQSPPSTLRTSPPEVSQQQPYPQHGRSSTTSALQTFKRLLPSQPSTPTSENPESRGRLHRRNLSTSSFDRAATSLRETALPVLKRLKRSLSRSNHTPVAQEPSKTVSYPLDRAREKAPGLGRSFTLPSRSAASKAPNRHVVRTPLAWPSNLNRAMTMSHPDSEDRTNVTTKADVHQKAAPKQAHHYTKASARDVSTNVVDSKHPTGKKAAAASKPNGTTEKRKTPSSHVHTRSSSTMSPTGAPTLLSRSASVPNPPPTRTRLGSASTKVFSPFKALPSVPR